MKILIIGSFNYSQLQNRRDQLIQACKDIGAALAKNGHVIIISTDNEDTVDRYIAEGVLNTPGKHKIIIHRPNDSRSTPFFDIQKTYPNTKFSYHRCQGDNWSAGRVQAIAEADAVILIGGGKGTAQAGYSAPVLQKPVLAIPSFDGAAKEIWESLYFSYKQAGINGDYIESLRENWSASSVENTVKSVEQLFKNNPFRKKFPIFQLILILLLFMLLALWISVYIKELAINDNIAIFILLIVSALLGSGLRCALSLTTGTGTIMSISVALSELTVSVLLAFGLCLIYLAGGIVFTGNFVNFTDSGNFSRVGVSISLIGLFAGLMVEEASSKLRNWLKKNMADK